ncbi:MAG TPA: fumarylacetoacetate hydrolase family protein [Thermodesulfovibrionales bacterium]|nr:fumarylacetoacetate hydrolase family protein [Thermodesulfovibrionales bacterium]
MIRGVSMYIVSYRSQGLWRAGIVQGSFVVDAAALVSPSSPSTVRALLDAGPAAVAQVLERARDAFARKSQLLMPLEGIELGPPVPDPDKIICLGLNYREHATEVQMKTSAVPPLFAKFRNALCGPNSPIVIPRISAKIDYEGELAVVIGRRCKEVSEDEALACVAGYAIMNDVSARDLQMQSSQWTAGKTLDTFAPMGPGIVPASEIPDPQTLQIVTRVNGVTLQNGNTRDMIFSVARTIAFLGSLMTLHPGDLIATGTPSGVGFTRQPPVFLKAGDIVEVEIERIGMIRNPVIGPGRKEDE